MGKGGRGDVQYPSCHWISVHVLAFILTWPLIFSIIFFCANKLIAHAIQALHFEMLIIPYRRKYAISWQLLLSGYKSNLDESQYCMAEQSIRLLNAKLLLSSNWPNTMACFVYSPIEKANVSESIFYDNNDIKVRK